MRITANQVTLLRLLLLPIPVVMLYGDSPGWLLAALVVFILLGLTDALDGWLARRYGGTPLGALLDPVVDKIFIVATIVPLADLKIVSPTLVIVLFVRELAITVLRSIAFEESFRFKTSRIAKLKTTVQMSGAGFIMILHLYPDSPLIFFVLLPIAAASLVPAVVSLCRRRTPGWKAVSGAILICGIPLLRAVMSNELAIVSIMIIIIAFTLVSGVEYFWTMRAVLWKRFRRSPVEIPRLCGLSLAVPLCYLPTMLQPGAPIYAILLILATELAAGGLDNSLARVGRHRPPAADLVRSVIQVATGLGVLWMLSGTPDRLMVHLFANLALLYTLADVLIRFGRNYEVFRVEVLSVTGFGNGDGS